MAANMHEQVVYDDPTLGDAAIEPNHPGRQQSVAFRQQQSTSGGAAVAPTTCQTMAGSNANNRLSLNVVRQQRFEFDRAPANLLGTLNRELVGGGVQPAAMKLNGGFNGANHHKPFNTVHSNSVRPHSSGLTDQVSFQQQLHHQQQHLQHQYSQQQQKQLQYLRDNGQLDDDLYNVLSDPRDDDCQSGVAPATSAKAQSNEPDYSNHVNAETSDSSQRTNEMLNCGSSDRLQPHSHSSNGNNSNSISSSSNYHLKQHMSSSVFNGGKAHEYDDYYNNN